MPPLPGRRGAPGRRATSATSALFFDRMEQRLPIGLGRDGEPLYAQPRLPRRHPRRARQHLRHLRRRHQDHLRHVPALRRCSTPACSAPRRVNTQGADLQREGRGPALPRPRRTSGSTPSRRDATATSGCPPAPFADVGVYAPPRARRPERRRPTSRAAQPGVDIVLSGRSRSSATDELLPFVFADAEDERQQYTMVVHNVAAHAEARRRARGDDGGVADRRRRRCARTATSSTSSSSRLTDDDPTVATWAGRAIGHGHDQRVRPPAARRRSGRSARLVRADVADRVAPPRSTRPTRRSRSSTCTTSTTGRKRFVVGVTLRQRVRATRSEPGSASRCCSSCSTSSTSTRRATATRRSRRSCSTSPSAAARSASS